MNTKSIHLKFSRIALFFLCTLFFYNCSSDDKIAETPDNRSFITDNTGFFINHDGTVNLIVSGVFKDGDISFGTVKSRGFVYGTTSKPAVNTTNTAVLNGTAVANSGTGYIKNLTSKQTYFIRGYFEMNNGSYFYGKEIQASTNVDASTTRTITLEIDAQPFFKSKTEITPKLNISNAKKELPAEIGYEYSVNNDFSNSTKKAIENYKGIHNNGILLQTSYASELIEGLTAATTYFFRPYAKYNDNTITNGGTNSVSFTTSN